MLSGVYWGYIAMIEGVVKRIREEAGESLRVVATGGLAPLFTDATDVIEAYDSDMTVRGLEQIHRRNSKS
jgi:type III pantothenate kinase